MKNENVFKNRTSSVTVEKTVPEKALHPAWQNFVRYCSQLQHGEIELLKIQDGLPVLAETIRKKVKFNS